MTPKPTPVADPIASTKNGRRVSGGWALIFPGQGSQHIGMGKEIAETSPAARRVFDEADEVVGFALSQVCFEGSEEELEDTVNTQPAILATSLAYLASLRERAQELGRRLRPSMMAGHSLGQFSAAVAANSVDFSDGLRLVMERGRIMAEWARTRPGGLVSILGLSDGDVRGICREASPDGKVDVAVVNAPGHTVIAGETGPLQRAVAIARERGARALRLPISVPSHTPIMQDAAREMSRFISTLGFRDPETPVVSNISARLLTTAEDVRHELADQISSAVEWARCVVTMSDSGVDSFVEVGPGQTLSRIVRRIRGDARTLSADGAPADDVLDLAAEVAEPVAKRRAS